MEHLDLAIQKCEEMSKNEQRICFVFPFLKEVDESIVDSQQIISNRWVVTTEEMLKKLPSRIPIYDSYFKET